MTDRIRPARPHELDAVEALIVRAFADEPFMTWVAGGDRERLARFVRLAVRRLAVPSGEVLVDAELTTAALVLPSGALDLGPLDQLRQLPDLVRAARLRRLPTVLRGLARLEAAHPEEPHDTLLTLGVDPAHHAEGRGSAMLQAIARRSALPLYLETASARGVKFYERHGYATLREVRLPRGPLVRAMLAR